MRFYEFYGPKKRIPRIAEGGTPKLLYDELDNRSLLDIDRERITGLYDVYDLWERYPAPEDLTVSCLEGVFTKGLI